MARRPEERKALVLLIAVVALVASLLQPARGQCSDAAQTLAAHNNYRSKHLNTPALTWNATLARAALAHAKKLAAAGCKLFVATSVPYGQNLAASYGSTAPQCVSSVGLWYSQSKNYVYTKTPFTDNVVAGKQVNSFTQVVWRGSKLLGCGGAANATEKCFATICFYSPPGNVQGNAFYLENVQPLGKRPPSPPPKKQPPSPPPKKSPPPRPPVACGDLLSFCADWKKKGYCSAQPQWLFDNKPVATYWCKKTCSKC